MTSGGCEAGVPEDVSFATKPKLGRALLERAVAAGVPCAWVAADSVYGGDYALRLWLERQPIGYVLAVTSKQRAPSGFDTVKERAAARFGTGDWQRLSAGDGAKGPRLYDWAYREYPSLQPGWNRGLLVRRSIAEPDKLTYYLTFAPEDTPVGTLVSVAGTRWTIESCFEAAKGEVGLDQYEVRTWTAWHRHVTLAMLALAFLTVVRAAAIGGRENVDLQDDLLPLTVPEIRLLLANLVGLPPPDPAAVIAWSLWRRRHQQRARRCHWKRRTQTDKDRL